MGIFVREAERCLDTSVFLDEHWRWPPLGSHHPFIMHQMFTHAKATGWKEHDQTICQASNSPPPNMTWRKSLLPWKSLGLRWLGRRLGGYIMRLPTKEGTILNPCDAEMAENIHQKILNSVKEHLWYRQEHVKPEEEEGWGSASASRPVPWSKFQQRVHAT